jgi:hypothetical protein
MTQVSAQKYCAAGLSKFRQVYLAKKSVRVEIIDILTQTCQPFIHDEDPAKNAL